MRCDPETEEARFSFYVAIIRSTIGLVIATLLSHQHRELISVFAAVATLVFYFSLIALYPWRQRIVRRLG